MIDRSERIVIRGLPLGRGMIQARPIDSLSLARVECPQAVIHVKGPPPKMWVSPFCAGAEKGGGGIEDLQGGVARLGGLMGVLLRR